MSLAKVLLCLDSDPQPSVFDAVVAVDAGADHLLRHSGVTKSAVRDLVHGAIFTRGPKDLASTAVFIGGADVEVGEELLAEAIGSFFGPLRVSVMHDSSGANTTAAAAIIAAGKHVNLAPSETAVVWGTGPVGVRAARLLAKEGACVRLVSRRLDRAREACDALARAGIEGVEPRSSHEEATESLLRGAAVLVAAGPVGVELVSAADRQAAESLRVVVDLNAVPPLGVGGLEAGDKATERDGQFCYGALGVGGQKMKIHKAAVRKLFESNDQVFDIDEIYELGKQLLGA